MPRRRRQQGLERVLGTPALFATAYGNVGSSIYYALGVTAVFALGLTPLVFVVAGLIFACTAATYAEGTVRYPEAGGSASFARHGVQRARLVRRRVVAAARLRRHRHDLGVLRPALPLDLLGAAEGEPLGRRRRDRRDPRARLAQRRRGPGSGRAQRRAGDRRLRDAAAPRAAGVLPRVQHRDPRRQHPLGRRADVVEPRARGARRDARLHGRRDRLEPRRGGPRPGEERPGRVQARGGRRLRDLLHAPADRALGDAGRPPRRGVRDVARPSARGGRLRERPGARPRPEPRALRARPRRARDLRGHPRRDDPADRDERRRDRRVTDHVLDVELPAASTGLPAAAPAVPHAVARDRHLRGDRADHRHPARGARRSSGRSTRSGRRCRSRSRTPRSFACVRRSRAPSSPSVLGRTSGGAACPGRSSRSSAGSRRVSRGW